MADVKKIATRDSYGKTLVELGAETENVVVMDADLAGATKTAMFKEAYPDRFFDCGIAEQNMAGTAAGMATMGLVPFISTFAMFASGRAFEIIRNSIGYPHLNVKICATHAGLSVGPDGATHQCNEDFGLMRTIPGMTVMCPADDIEACQMIRAAYEMEGPVYIRLGRSPIPVFHNEDYKFEIGKAEVVKEGNDVAIIATGIMVYEAMKAADMLKEKGISARVINMPTIKPIDKEIIETAAKECGKIVTVEEHNIYGGLGEAVSSVVTETCPVPVKRIGVNDVFGKSGTADEVLRDYGLTDKNIAQKTLEFVG